MLASEIAKATVKVENVEPFDKIAGGEERHRYGLLHGRHG